MQKNNETTANELTDKSTRKSDKKDAPGGVRGYFNKLFSKKDKANAEVDAKDRRSQSPPGLTFDENY